MSQTPSSVQVISMIVYGVAFIPLTKLRKGSVYLSQPVVARVECKVKCLIAGMFMFIARKCRV